MIINIGPEFKLFEAEDRSTEDTRGMRTSKSVAKSMDYWYHQSVDSRVTVGLSWWLSGQRICCWETGWSGLGRCLEEEMAAWHSCWNSIDRKGSSGARVHEVTKVGSDWAYAWAGGRGMEFDPGLEDPTCCETSLQPIHSYWWRSEAGAPFHWALAPQLQAHAQQQERRHKWWEACSPQLKSSPTTTSQLDKVHEAMSQQDKNK